MYFFRFQVEGDALLLLQHPATIVLPVRFPFANVQSLLFDRKLFLLPPITNAVLPLTLPVPPRFVQPGERGLFRVRGIERQCSPTPRVPGGIFAMPCKQTRFPWRAERDRH